jgi:hypothetical protein
MGGLPPESGHDEIKWRRAGIAATNADRFIGKKLMLAGNHCLLVSSVSVLTDDYCG